MVEMIDKWEVVSKLITLQNNYNFFKNEWDAQRLYREIAKLEISIGKTPGVEVVRCKDCKWYQIRKWDDEKPRYDCRKTHALLDVEPDDFCSYGERKDYE